MKSPIPIKAKEKVSKKDNPIIKVLILEEIFWTISEELDGLCIENILQFYYLINKKIQIMKNWLMIQLKNLKVLFQEYYFRHYHYF